eukprot:CAMPEP_0167757848 /NCGR_PEP_ID=MMETSP0110_2-20121227/10149_1 /TAXON_ID=629695 /ORGANISM="Gymnochlora sp., Strain CCMP2014" /LENGTH=37 /DNA_ID= /DNA_START= /DNA_END= /DNA_ORIENTATION=
MSILKTAATASAAERAMKAIPAADDRVFGRIKETCMM